MLKKFTVTNYKNFVHPIQLDLGSIGKYQYNKELIKEDLLSKLIIYGKNGTGKTNFGKALSDIKNLIFSDFPNSNDYEIVYCANDEQKTIQFDYEFKIDNNEIHYFYEKDRDDNLLYESLSVDSKKIFDVSFEKKGVDLLDLKRIGIETYNIEQYKRYLEEDSETEKMPFLRWIFNNTIYLDRSLAQKLWNEIKGIEYLSIANTVLPYPSFIKRNAKKLKSGIVSDLQKFLSYMGLDYKLKVIESADGNEQIYFDYKTPLLFYENASSGTKALVEFYSRIYPVLNNTTILFLDEFDVFFHFKLAENFIKYLIQEYPDVQVIFTSHNTDLMTNRFMRPDALLILSTKGKLVPLYKATNRELREGHNLEKMYHSGEFSLNE